MAVNRQAVFEGTERRSGFERRTVAPRESASGPRILATIALDKNYGPGMEKQFHEAVQRENERAKAENRPGVDLELLESKGYLSGFAGKSREVQFARNHQTERGERDPVETPDPGTRKPWPGMLPLEEVAPVPPQPGEAGRTAFESGLPGAAVIESRAPAEGSGERTVTPARGGGARTGGAGRTRGKSGSKR